MPMQRHEGLRPAEFAARSLQSHRPQPDSGPRPRHTSRHSSCSLRNAVPYSCATPLEVRVTHEDTESVLVCEHEVSLREVAEEKYTRFRLVNGRLDQCWSPLEQQWLNLRHKISWTLSAGPTADGRPNVHVVPLDGRRNVSSLCALGSSAASERVWLKHEAGFLIGIYDERMATMHTHPIVRGHSMRSAGKGVRRAAVGASCREPGALFRVHPLTTTLRQVQRADAGSRSGFKPALTALEQFFIERASPEELTAQSCTLRMAASCRTPVRILAGVVSHGRGLVRRGIPILRTWGRTMPTHVLAEQSAAATSALQAAGCTMWSPEPGIKHEQWSCQQVQWGVLDAAAAGTASTGERQQHTLQESRALLLSGCAGTEMAGCCRVIRWLEMVLPDAGAPLSFDWLLLVDDDVYVRPDIACVLTQLPHERPLFLPAKHAHNTSTTMRCEERHELGLRDCHRVSICGERGPVHMRTTQLSLPAGYGALSAGFARLLATPGWLTRLRFQCTASSWFYDLTLAFAAWAFHVDLSPALDWTWRDTNSWLGGQRWLWTAGSVINHKVDGEYDFVHLLHTCADGEGVHPPNASALAPFVQSRVQQAEYLPLVEAAAAKGMATVPLRASSGQLWSCDWAGGWGLTRDASGAIVKAGVKQPNENRGPVPSMLEATQAVPALVEQLDNTSTRPLLASDKWAIVLQPGDIPLCVKAYGVDRPCNTSSSWQSKDACRIRNAAEARAYCAADPMCAGLMFSNKRDVATLKWRHSWMDPHDAVSRGWISAPSGSLGGTLATAQARLLECQELSARLGRESLTNGKCPRGVARAWHDRGCEEFTTNGVYGGSAMHVPREVCMPTTPLRNASGCAPLRAGCLMVVLRGHAFRLGGQFTVRTTNSTGMIRSQLRVLSNIRANVLEPAMHIAKWSIPSILVDAVYAKSLAATWRDMCTQAFSGFRVAVRPLAGKGRPGSRLSQAASMSSTWQWALVTAAQWESCWDAVLVLRVDVAFKMPLPLPAPWSPPASFVHLPHPAPPCGGLTATPNGHRRVGDTFFYVPRDLYGRLQYAFAVKDELDIKSIALHDLSDWLPLERLRFWMRDEYQSNTAIAPNPLFFQTGRDGATSKSQTCAVKPISVPWAADGEAVWAEALQSARAQAHRLLGSYPYASQASPDLGSRHHRGTAHRGTDEALRVRGRDRRGVN